MFPVDAIAVAVAPVVADIFTADPASVVIGVVSAVTAAAVAALVADVATVVAVVVVAAVVVVNVVAGGCYCFLGCCCLHTHC